MYDKIAKRSVGVSRYLWGMVKTEGSKFVRVRLGPVTRWGVSSLKVKRLVPEKKTGCRRRKVIKEDLEAEEDEAVEDMVSSSLKGPYLSAANGFRRGLAMARLKWSSNTNSTQ